ncbi:AAA family ATPase [Micromonospora lupini]|uniref:UvrD-helicase domain-containing protein n=1 Tax=Micromonospora lupini TaxID=285679 RepID=UPI00225BFD24|nr:UvrD-helicase domain-containing protein [Micromonospora lupini]MCX5066708.1 AAA family ATPase [Micromonospora lupini]
MEAHRPTDEQQAVIDAFTSADRPTLVVQAGAGCGKSSTLKMAAHTQPNRKGLYVVFSKALQLEASKEFPSAVDCRTAHSLAFGPVGRFYRDRLDGPRVPAFRVAQILGFHTPVQIADDLAPLVPNTLGRLTLDAVGKFLNSADEEPSVQHVARVDGYTREQTRDLATYLLPYMRKAWKDLQLQRGGLLKFPPDAYLKMYQLTRPRIPVDYVLLDEAQDLSPVMASLFHFQDHAQRIMVGDSAQAIYAFRGAIDAMAKFHADQRLTLSQSFRFGPAVADEANKWLDLLDAPLRLRGFPPAGSRLAHLDQPEAILCRSNAGAISQVMQAAAAGRRVALVGKADELRRLAEAAEELMDGRPTGHPELVAFQTWDQVREHAQHDDASGNLQVLVKLIDDHTPAEIINVVNGLVDEKRADVVVSTAHKAKGREWDRVKIAGDFREPRRDKQTGEAVLVKDELRLAYVAVTRARKVLDRFGLVWVDEYVQTFGRMESPAEEVARTPLPSRDEAAPLVLDRAESATFHCGQLGCTGVHLDANEECDPAHDFEMPAVPVAAVPAPVDPVVIAPAPVAVAVAPGLFGSLCNRCRIYRNPKCSACGTPVGASR